MRLLLALLLAAPVPAGACAFHGVGVGHTGFEGDALMDLFLGRQPLPGQPAGAAGSVAATPAALPPPEAEPADVRMARLRADLVARTPGLASALKPPPAPDGR